MNPEMLNYLWVRSWETNGGWPSAREITEFEGVMLPQAAIICRSARKRRLVNFSILSVCGIYSGFRFVSSALPLSWASPLLRITSLISKVEKNVQKIVEKI